MKTSSFLLVLFSIYGSACASVTASYSPPPALKDNTSEWSRSIAKPYDDVWRALVSHISSTFFAIENFEKDSGLMTLSFGTSDIGAFVDGGHWQYKESKGMDLATGKQVGMDINFDGNYATFISQYRNASLSGKMNLFVRQTSATSTEVRVHARYLVSMRTANAPAGYVEESWSFDTGGFDTIVVSSPIKGTSAERTLRPTHKAERAILDAVAELAVEH